MPKKHARRKHPVKVHLQTIELFKAGSSIDLDIYASRQKIGTLKIGRGSLFWYGRIRQNRKRIS